MLKTGIIKKLKDCNLILTGLTTRLDSFDVFADENTTWIEVNDGGNKSNVKFILFEGIQKDKILYNGGEIDILGYCEGLAESCEHKNINDVAFSGSESAFDYTDTFYICSHCGQITNIKRESYNY